MSKTYRWTYGVISKIPFSDKHFFLFDCDRKIHPVIFGCEWFRTVKGWHGIDVRPVRFNILLHKLHTFNACSEYQRYTKRRHYATLEFRSAEEARYWEGKACFLVKFQRIVRDEQH